MRIALLNRDPAAPPVQRLELPDCPHDARLFNLAAANSTYESPAGRFADLVSLYPIGWKPDVFLHWSLEYSPMPLGVEEADCFTVATVGDWNLGAQAFRQCGGAFDLLIADQQGCQRLQQAGFRARYAPLWYYDANVHRRLPESEIGARDIDILMVGNFNPDIQRERARWLGRVARLSQKYRVCITSHVFGEEYVCLLNRAKIVFNRSLRGEINMRVYEAMACGALLFYERENLEARALFTEGEHYVGYGDDDLEALLHYYLTHDAERERVAEEGNEAVQPFQMQGMYRRLFTEIAEAMGDACQTNIVSFPRPWHGLSAAERRYRIGCHYLNARTPPPFSVTEEQAGNAQATNLRVCTEAEAALRCNDMEGRQAQLCTALQSARAALQSHPDHITLRFNMAQILLALSDSSGAFATLQALFAMLNASISGPTALSSPYFPRGFDLFTVEIERLWSEQVPESPEGAAALQTLLRWRVAEQLGEIALAQGACETALHFARAAIAARPDLVRTQVLLARSLRALGAGEEAETCYRAALEEVPLDPILWNELATLLLEIKQAERCQAFLVDVEAMLDGCPFYESWCPVLTRLQSAVRRLASRLS